MTDRLKYRVWDKVSKRYFFLELKFGDNGYHPRFIEKPVFEQCTGLKDENGKLIYEGDIVKINGWWDACGPAGYNENQTVVKWNEEFAGYEPMCIYDCDCQVYHYAEECEIIGNIHENGDLLDG